MKNVALRQMLAADNWPRRRKWMKVILCWAMLNVQYLVFWGKPNSLHETIAVMLIGLIISIAGTYVFGAVWDDNDKRRHLAQHPEIDEAVE